MVYTLHGKNMSAPSGRPSFEVSYNIIAITFEKLMMRLSLPLGVLKELKELKQEHACLILS
jgi:hypothetical protein